MKRTNISHDKLTKVIRIICGYCCTQRLVDTLRNRHHSWLWNTSGGGLEASGAGIPRAIFNSANDIFPKGLSRTDMIPPLVGKAMLGLVTIGAFRLFPLIFIAPVNTHYQGRLHNRPWLRVLAVGLERVQVANHPLLV